MSTISKLRADLSLMFANNDFSQGGLLGKVMVDRDNLDSAFSRFVTMVEGDKDPKVYFEFLFVANADGVVSMSASASTDAGEYTHPTNKYNAMFIYDDRESNRDEIVRHVHKAAQVLANGGVHCAVSQGALWEQS